MGAMNKELVPVSISCYIGTLSTAGDYPLAYFPKNFVLTGAKLLDQNGVATGDTNYVTLSIKNGATTLMDYDSRAAHEGAATANVGKAFAAVATAPIDVAAGSSLKMTYAEGGTGTLTLAQVVLEGFWK
jgi:hypothetical protein